MLLSFYPSFIIISFLKTQFILSYDLIFSFVFGSYVLGRDLWQAFVCDGGSVFRKISKDEAQLQRPSSTADLLPGEILWSQLYP